MKKILFIFLILILYSTPIFASGVKRLVVDDDKRFIIRKEGKYGYADSGGNVTVEPVFLQVSDFSDDLAYVRTTDEVYIYIDRKGEQAFPGEYNAAGSFVNGLAPVRVAGESDYTYIKTDGSVLSSERYLEASEFCDGRARVRLTDGEYAYIDKAAEVIVKVGAHRPGHYSEGFAVIIRDGRFRVLDRNGNECLVLAPDVNGVCFFSEGLLPVAESGKWGYINPAGTKIIECRFDMALPFVNDLAPVMVDGYWGYIRRDGQYHISPTFPHHPQLLDEYADAVQEFIDKNRDGTDFFGNIFKRNNMRFIYHPTDMFSQKLFFREGRAVFYKKHSGIDRFGYIDRAGKVVIEPFFTSAEPFRDGFAVVKPRGKHAIIDKKIEFLYREDWR